MIRKGQPIRRVRCHLSTLTEFEETDEAETHSMETDESPTKLKKPGKAVTDVEKTDEAVTEIKETDGTEAHAETYAKPESVDESSTTEATDVPSSLPTVDEAVTITEIFAKPESTDAKNPSDVADVASSPSSVGKEASDDDLVADSNHSLKVRITISTCRPWTPERVMYLMCFWHDQFS